MAFDTTICEHCGSTGWTVQGKPCSDEDCYQGGVAAQVLDGFTDRALQVAWAKAQLGRAYRTARQRLAQTKTDVRRKGSIDILTRMAHPKKGLVMAFAKFKPTVPKGGSDLQWIPDAIAEAVKQAIASLPPAAAGPAGPAGPKGGKGDKGAAGADGKAA